MELPERLARLQTFKCHKEVRAARIVGMQSPPLSRLELDPGDGQEGTVWHEVPSEYFTRQRPQLGGYLVVYADGEQAFSQAAAFEEGHRPIEAGGKKGGK